MPNSLFPAVFDLSMIDGTNGFKSKGATAGDYSGFTVAGAGDVNADGIPDILVGSRFDDPLGRANAGSCTVLFGKLGVGANALDFSNITGSGFKFRGAAAADEMSYSLNTAGDVNGDGVSDFIVGAYFGDPGRSDAGISYLVFGRSDLGSTGDLDPSALTGSIGFRLNGISVNDWSGISVAKAGDVNADGIDDLIVGAYGVSSQTGSSYVVFGKKNWTQAVVELSSLNGNNGFRLGGMALGDLSGGMVGSAGDFNGDGIADLMIGSSKADPSGKTDAGTVHIIYGKVGLGNTSAIALSSLPANAGCKINGAAAGDRFGISGSFIHDFNQDGWGDLILSAPYADPNGKVDASTSYILFGGPNRCPSGVIELSALSAADGIKINGETAGDAILSVSYAGDLNGDGVPDVVLGSSTADPNAKANAGRSYVVFGGAGSPGVIELATLGDNVFKINGETAGDGSGLSVAGIGDVNADGVDDILIGAPYASPGGKTQAGGTYAVFGRMLKLMNNTLTISEGQAKVLSIAEIAALTRPNLNITDYLLIPSNVSHARFQYASAPGVAITNFTQKDVQDGLIQVVHDGGEDAPSYFINAKTGNATTGFKPATINFTHVNDAPVLATPYLRLNQRERVVLNRTHVNATDPDNSPAQLHLTVSDLQHGRFERANNATVALTEFTQADIDAGNICFVSEGEFSPTFSLSVSDGQYTTAAQPAAIDFNFLPLLDVSPLSLNQGELLILNNTHINATDSETARESLEINIDLAQHCRFELVSNPGTPISHFTQEDIDNERVCLIHDGSSSMPQLALSVFDGRGRSLAQAIPIAFNALPVLQVRIPVNQGGTLILNRTHINTTDDTPSSSLILRVSDLQYARFEMLRNPGFPVRSFTQASLDAGEVIFIHDGSTNPPQFTISVSDGQLSTSEQIPVIDFNLLPILVNKQIDLNQGDTIVISANMLAIQDPDSFPESLLFTVNSVQYGQFELVSNPGTAIAHFTQADIHNASVRFVHDGSAFKPFCSVSVSDGRVSLATQNITINFNLLPFLVNNQIPINKGQEQLIKPSYLRAIGPEEPDTEVVFILDEVQNGEFLPENSSAPFSNFTQDDINQLKVRFVPDGSDTPPWFKVTLKDGKASSPPLIGNIVFNRPPVIIHAALPNLSQGASVRISNAHISASDADGNEASLQFIVSNVHAGYFALNTSPTQSISTFTQQQITNGRILFVHDGSINAPSFDLNVSDGKVNVGPVSSLPILFNRSPVIVINRMQVNQGQEVTVTNNALSATDFESSSASLVFQVSDLKNGQFLKSGLMVTNFTQKDINDGLIRFKHDNSLEAPSYNVTVTDGLASSMSSSAVVTYSNNNSPPRFIQCRLEIEEGETKILTPLDLGATDEDNIPASLVFEVSNVKQGEFLVNNRTVTQFTQQQVSNGQVAFRHNGEELAPSFNVSVTDGSALTGPIPAQISFTHVNDAPLIAVNRLSINGGQSQRLTTADLWADDPDTLDANLLFQVSNSLYCHMVNIRTKESVTNFTQAQIKNLDIQVVSEGKNAPSYNVTVSDGIATSASSAADVTFTDGLIGGASDNSSSMSATLRNGLIAFGITGTMSVCLWGSRLYAKRKIDLYFHRGMIGQENETQQAFREKVLEPIERVVSQQVNMELDPALRKMYLSALQVIVDKLELAGVKAPDIIRDDESEGNRLNRSLLLNTIAHHVAAATAKKSRYCTMFQRAVTPADISGAAYKIARHVADEFNGAMGTLESKHEGIELVSHSLASNELEMERYRLDLEIEKAKTRKHEAKTVNLRLTDSIAASEAKKARAEAKKAEAEARLAEANLEAARMGFSPA